MTMSFPKTTDASIRKVMGRGIPLRGESIDTDRILPARYLRCVTFQGLEEHVFEDDRSGSGTSVHPFDAPAFKGASILVVNRNFGCGSSREHAPQGLWRWGIRSVVGESFAEIFFGNCVALGVPCVTLEADSVQELQAAVEAAPSSEITVDLAEKTVTLRPARGSVKKYSASIPEGARSAFTSGTWDAASLLSRDPAEIHRVAGSLPYVGGFGG